MAETISLRRRKGTVLVMEQLARDVTGWGAHAVEFFQVLADTQYMNHIRLGNHYAPDLRRWQPGLYIDTGFDRTAHKVDVRRIASGRGRYNIQNIGIFLWSLSAYSVTGASPTAAATNGATGQLCYRFSSLGMDIPLFHRAVSQGEQITAAAQPVNVVDRLRRRVLCDDLQRGVGAAYYGIGKSLVLYHRRSAGQPLSASGGEPLRSRWQLGQPARRPAAPMARSSIPNSAASRCRRPPPDQPPPALTVSYYYGFNADMGGGEYARNDGFIVTDAAWIIPFPDPRFATLQDALNFAVSQFALNGQVAVEIAGSDTWSMAGPLSVDLPAGTTLELRAADPTRPTLLLDGELAVTGDASSTFILNGFVVAAGAAMIPATLPATPAALVHLPALRPGGTTNLLGQLSLTHCTLVPGWSVGPNGDPLHPAIPALIVEPAGVEIIGERSILGSIRAASFATVSLTDSIVDATDLTQVAYAALDGSQRRRGSDARRMHRRRQGPCRPAHLGFRQHLLVGARPRRYRALDLQPRRRSQAGRLCPFQLPTLWRGHAAPLRVRRAGARLAAAAVLFAALWASRLHEAARFYRRHDPSRRG